MTPEKVKEVIGTYRSLLERLGIPKECAPLAEPPANVSVILGHCRWMLDEAERHLTEGREDKAKVWLGFVQGCLWSCRVYTVDQLRDQNRPDAERLTR